jgi:hypothetical protein
MIKRLNAFVLTFLRVAFSKTLTQKKKCDPRTMNKSRMAKFVKIRKGLKEVMERNVVLLQARDN